MEVINNISRHITNHINSRINNHHSMHKAKVSFAQIVELELMSVLGFAIIVAIKYDNYLI